MSDKHYHLTRTAWDAKQGVYNTTDRAFETREAAINSAPLRTRKPLRNDNWTQKGNTWYQVSYCDLHNCFIAES